MILYRFAKKGKEKKKKVRTLLRLTASNPRGRLFSADIEIQARVCNFIIKKKEKKEKKTTKIRLPIFNKSAYLFT